MSATRREEKPDLAPGYRAAPGVPAAPPLVRHRLNRLLSGAGEYRVGLVVAPAGSGKSTLLAQVARDHDGPVAWCDLADPTPRSARSLVAALVDAVGAEVEQTSPPPADMDELVAVLAVAQEPLLVVLDDVHLLEGSEAEAALGVLVDRVPAPVRLLIASRVNLDVDLSRARVSGRVAEVGADDLRFRTWEVEQLFGTVYRQRLGPEDIAILTRRTAGWAAYLQLFHLASARRTPIQRRQLLTSLSNPSRTVRDYLTRQVLAELSPDLADFLIRTSVLRRPTAALCDRLLDRAGSADALDELERRQVFTERVELDDSFRYHAVLLAYLDGRLIETLGIAAARDEHRRAAGLLVECGYLEEAVTAYAKAEAWSEVRSVLDRLGVAGGETDLGEALLDLLPAPTLATDPWLLSMKARQSLGRGNLRQAVAEFAAAETVASGALRERCRDQRSQIGVWAMPEAATGDDWSSLLRAATQRAPLVVSRRTSQMSGPTGRFVEAMAALMAGDVGRAARVARSVSSDATGAPLVVAAAEVVAALVAFVTGTAMSAEEVALLRESIEVARLPWLDRLALAFQGLAAGRGAEEIEQVRRSCQADGDRWGEALIGSLVAVAALTGDAGGVAQGAQRLEEVAATFGDLGAGVLETWATTYAAVAWWRSGDVARAVVAAGQARTLASLREVPGAAGVAALVLGSAAGDDRQLRWAEQVLVPFELWDGPCRLMQVRGPLPDPNPGPGPVVAGPEIAPDDPPSTVIRCLGRFSLIIDGRPIDDTAAKPMERTALHLLVIRAGELVHREELGEALWPGADPEAARHRLQVAISALRRLVEPPDASAPQHLVRSGDAYGFVVPDDADVDLWRLRDASRSAGSARSQRDADGEGRALEAVLAAYDGPLLPGDGPADWVVGPRSAAQATASAAALRLATLRRDAGDLEGAGDAARRGLEVDRYRDDLWRTAIAVAEGAGHQAEASQLRAAYEAVLVEIGVA